MIFIKMNVVDWRSILDFLTAINRRRVVEWINVHKHTPINDLNQISHRAETKNDFIPCFYWRKFSTNQIEDGLSSSEQRNEATSLIARTNVRERKFKMFNSEEEKTVDEEDFSSIVAASLRNVIENSVIDLVLPYRILSISHLSSWKTFEQDLNQIFKRNSKLKNQVWFWLLRRIEFSFLPIE